MGFLVAIANALTVSAQDVLVKKLTGEDKFFLIWVRIAGALPVLAILVTIFASWSVPPWQFWALILGVSVPLETLAFWLGYAALQKMPLSLAAPLHGFTGVFLIPVGYLMLGEVPSVLGLVGVLSIFVGVFFLGRAGSAGGILGSFRNLLRAPGAWTVLAAAFIVTIPISIAKISFHYAPPLLTAFYIAAAMAAALIPFVLRSGAGVRILGNGHFIAASAVISGASLGLHYTGLSLLPAAYFISTKRLSILFNVLYGRLVFSEDHIRERFLGGAFMVAGVILIAVG